MNGVCLPDRALTLALAFLWLVLEGVFAIGPTRAQGVLVRVLPSATTLTLAAQMLFASADRGSVRRTTVPATGVSLVIPVVHGFIVRAIEEIRGFWETLALRVHAASNLGDLLNRRTLVRFEAHAAPKAYLFTGSAESVAPLSVEVKSQ